MRYVPEPYFPNYPLYPGISLRDHIATAVLIAHFSHAEFVRTISEVTHQDERRTRLRGVALTCYACADAMIEGASQHE